MPPKDRDIAMVFQNYALYPHMSVEENMAFSLKMAKVPAAERKERVAKAAEILGLTEYLERKPKALSGGQRQRVAMGRAIVRAPQVFCMDEPLSNLDAKMRVQTRTDIARLQQDLGVTTVYVTHDQVEAMTMGDRVAVMKLGVLQQVDTPLKLYDKPANLFVAGFIGSPQMNLMEGTAVDGDVKVGQYTVPVDPTAERKMSGRVTVGVRPESWRIITAEDGGLPVKVTVVEELGADSFVYGTCDVEGTPSNVIVRVAGRQHPQKGETLYVTTDPRASTSSTPSRASASPTESSSRTVQYSLSPGSLLPGLRPSSATSPYWARDVRHRFRAAADRPGARPARHGVAGLRRRRRARGHRSPGRGRPGGARVPAGRAARARRAQAAGPGLVPAVLDGGLRRLRRPLRRDAARGGGARGVPAWSWVSATST